MKCYNNLVYANADMYTHICKHMQTHVNKFKHHKVFV